MPPVKLYILLIFIALLDSMASDEKQKKTVRYKTFTNWNTGGHIAAEEDKRTGNVKQIWCRLCAKHSEHVIRIAKIKGNAKEETQKYICGTQFVTKHNVFRHLGSVSHKIAIDLERSETRASSAVSDSGTNSNKGINNDEDRVEIDLDYLPINVNNEMSQGMSYQPKIDQTLTSSSNEAYRKLFNCAYVLAIDGLPFNKFKTLVNVLKSNGIQLICKYDNSNRAKELVHYLANAVREKLASILKDCSAFAILTDGSQARKTGAEKELIFCRVIHHGTPQFFCLGLQDIDGDSTAENLKTAVDDLFQSKVILSPADYTNKLTSFTSDGASVNTGTKNGLIKQMRDSREWMVDIHCVLHRIELALKDSIMKLPLFSGVFDFMVLIFYEFKRSGKLAKHFKKMSDICDARTLKFPKVHGTRFISHQKRGLISLLENWVVLALTLEDSIKSSKNSKNSAKLGGILKKLKDFQFLYTCVTYLEIVNCVSELSLHMERQNLLVTEVMPSVERAKDSLKDIGQGEKSYIDKIHEHGFKLQDIQETTTHYVLSKTSLRAGRKHDTNQEENQISLPGVKFQEVFVNKVDESSRKAIESIIKCVDERFSSFNQDIIFQNLWWIDPANWTDFDKEYQAIMWCSKHFEIPLIHTGFNGDRVKGEWKDFKRTVSYFYQNVAARTLWQNIFNYRRTCFVNLCKIVEIILCLGPSNGVVESGFSFLTGMLTDLRLSMNHSSMEDILLIKVNNLVWDEKDSIIETALNSFMNDKRRKGVMESHRCTTTGVFRDCDVSVTNDFEQEKPMELQISDSDDETDNAIDMTDDLDLIVTDLLRE